VNSVDGASAPTLKVLAVVSGSSFPEGGSFCTGTASSGAEFIASGVSKEVAADGVVPAIAINMPSKVLAAKLAAGEPIPRRISWVPLTRKQLSAEGHILLNWLPLP
jgi:hypothetical protein